MSTSAGRTSYDLASEHGGYFATREAVGAGLSHRQLSYYVTSGDLERVAHGVYRLVNFPAHPHGDMIAATLWAGPDSAVSHDSALAAYGLASAMPAVIHVTVPRAFSGQRKGVHIHVDSLRDDERRVWDEIPVTTVERTLIDLADDAEPSLVRAAAGEALSLGLTTRPRLAREVARSDSPARVRRVFGLRLPVMRDAM